MGAAVVVVVALAATSLPEGAAAAPMVRSAAPGTPAAPPTAAPRAPIAPPTPPAVPPTDAPQITSPKLHRPSPPDRPPVALPRLPKVPPVIPEVPQAHLLTEPISSRLILRPPPLPDASHAPAVESTRRSSVTPSPVARPSRRSESRPGPGRAHRSSAAARRLAAKRAAAASGAAAAALAERFLGSTPPSRPQRAASPANAPGPVSRELTKLFRAAYRFMASVPAPLFALVLALLVGMMLMFRRERRRARIAEHAALSDPLTGLPNRLALEHRLAIEWERARRYGRPLGVIALDLDELKLVNDRHGHAAGDRLLCQAADLLSRRVRRSDCAARLGGDEFVVLVTETRSRDIAALADAIRDSLGAAGVSASVGRAELAAGDSDPADVLRRADADMYREKHASRKQGLRLAEPAATEGEVARV